MYLKLIKISHSNSHINYRQSKYSINKITIIYLETHGSLEKI